MLAYVKAASLALICSCSVFVSLGEMVTRLMIIISNITLLRCLYNKQQTQAEINLIILNLIKKQILFGDFCFIMFYFISGRKKNEDMAKHTSQSPLWSKILYLPDLGKTNSDKIHFLLLLVVS